MRRFNLPTHFLLAVVIAIIPSAFSAPLEQEDKLGAQGIFDAALAQFESSRIALRKWQYYQTLTTHQLDRAGKVAARGTWRSIVRPGDPQPLEFISKNVQGNLSFFEEGAEEQETAEKNPGTQKSTSKSEKNQAESAVEAVRKYDLRNRYLWKRLADETVAGESAYVISFEPKPKQNTKSREERFFSLLAGKLWISRNDFTLLKAEAALQSPCQLFWIIARVTTFQLTYEVEPIRSGNRLLRLSRASAKTVVSFPLYAIRQNHWQTVTKYEPRTARRDEPKSR